MQKYTDKGLIVRSVFGSHTSICIHARAVGNMEVKTIRLEFPKDGTKLKQILSDAAVGHHRQLIGKAIAAIHFDEPIPNVELEQQGTPHE